MTRLKRGQQWLQRETRKEATAAIQGRDDGGLNWVTAMEMERVGQILKEQLQGLTEGLEVGGEGKGETELKNDSEVSGSSH